MFSDIQSIGVSLGVKRTPTNENDLPLILGDYKALYCNTELSERSWLVERRALLANGCNLTGKQYRIVTSRGMGTFPRLGEVCFITKGISSSTKTEPGLYPLLTTAENPTTSDNYQFDSDAVCVPLISSTGHGRATLKRIHYASGKFALANLLAAVQPRDKDKLSTKYLYYILGFKKDSIALLMKGAANVSMNVEDLAKFQIPLQPLEVQQEIVAEIDGYQKVIDGARAVLDNYHPHIPIHPDWPMVALDDVCSVNPQKSEINKLDRNTIVSFVPMAAVNENAIGFEPRDSKTLAEVSNSYTYFKENDVLLAKVTPCFENGKAGIARNLTNGIGFGSSEFYVLRSNGSILPEWIYICVTTPKFREIATAQMTGTGGLQRVPRAVVEGYSIPLPSLETQQQIVAEIEAEQALVAANRELIARMERKIQAAIAGVWGEEKTV